MTELKMTNDEYKHYQRHLSLTGFGVEKQLLLKKASVLVIGAGGLGCPMLQYLAAAGVGTIGIVDYDVVDQSNLQRQILYGYEDIGESKAEAAAKRLNSLNPHIKVKVHKVRFDESNALDLVSGYDVVADGSDNFKTRYLVNDACVMAGKPLSFAAIFQYDGQLSVFNYKGGPTYRCLFPEPPQAGMVPNCSQTGVLGVLPGVLGCLQATEVIKIITGVGEALSGKLLLFDLLGQTQNVLKFSLQKENLALKELKPIVEEYCEFIPESEVVTPRELEKLLLANDVQLIDIREPWEIELCCVDGAKSILVEELADEDALDGLDLNQLTVLICKVGQRSDLAIEEFKTYGFKNIKNLEGGLLQWSEDTERDFPKY